MGGESRGGSDGGAGGSDARAVSAGALEREEAPSVRSDESDSELMVRARVAEGGEGGEGTPVSAPPPPSPPPPLAALALRGCGNLRCALARSTRCFT